MTPLERDVRDIIAGAYTGYPLLPYEEHVVRRLMEVFEKQIVEAVREAVTDVRHERHDAEFAEGCTLCDWERKEYGV